VSHTCRRLSNGYGIFLQFGKQHRHNYYPRGSTFVSPHIYRAAGRPHSNTKYGPEFATSARAYKTEKDSQWSSPRSSHPLVSVLRLLRVRVEMRDSEPDMRGGDQPSRLLCEVCALLLATLPLSPAGPDATVPAPGSRAARRAQVSPAGFVAFLLGASLAMILCGSVTFLIGFLLMPLVIGFLMLLYVVGIFSNLSGLWRAILCPRSSSSPNEVSDGGVGTLRASFGTSLSLFTAAVAHLLSLPSYPRSCFPLPRVSPWELPTNRSALPPPWAEDGYDPARKIGREEFEVQLKYGSEYNLNDGISFMSVVSLTSSTKAIITLPSSVMIITGFDINKLSQEARTRWLKPVEVLYILQNFECFEITQKPPQKPPSGSLFLFNRRVLRYFRNDGHSWRKKTNGKTVREGHERLKVGNSEALNCYYAHGEQNSYFQRRSYWILDPAYEHIVLVHYREVVEGRHTPRKILSISNESSPTLRYSTSVSNDLAQCFPSHTSELNEPCQNSCSLVSVEEVSSKFERRNIETSHLNRMDRSESCNHLLLPELNQALRKLKEQLSLDDDDEDNFVSPKKELLPHCNLNVETHDLQHLNYEIKNSQDETLQNPLDEFKQMSDGHFDEDGMQYDDMLNNSDIWYDQNQFEAPREIGSSLNFPQGYLFTIREIAPEWAFSSENTKGMNWDVDYLFSGESSLMHGFPSSNPFELGLLPGFFPFSSLNQVSQMQQQYSDKSHSSSTLYPLELNLPWFCFPKVIITGNFLCSPSECEWTALFGDTEVPLETVQDGVFRCLAPRHISGKVKLCITSGNGKPCSEVREFEFREKLQNTSSSSTLSQIDTLKTSEELLLLVNLVQILLSGHSTSVTQEDEFEQEVNPLWKLKGSKNQLELIIRSILTGSEPPGNITELILQELLKDKLQQWLSSKHQGEPDDGCLLSKQDQCIIHMISGLGYQWALHPILDSGLCINYRDSNGWTALHWAARFGREEMVASLLAAGASAGVVTDPSSRDPAGQTPASLAVANGHKGLAGYLSEAALTNHLFSLTTEKTEILEGSSSVKAERGVDNISERRAHLQGGTENQLSLKDSLEAVRNATQAAARIQAAFRAYSFRKKQQADIVRGIYDMSQTDIYGFSVASPMHKTILGFRDHKFVKAAVSIQKNYRCWKKRKEFLQLRSNVVKIQSHFRAHLTKKKYKEFLRSVGVLEKIMLRWYRRGVGLRGFQAEPKPIVEEEEDDIIKVFRKQKVDKALDEALSRVISVVESPEAREQYRRMLESYQQAQAELSQCG
ncbi:calmodulin-binding transcription activator, partial [Musa troglodytarum]